MKKLLFALSLTLFSLGSAQTVYAGITTSTPISEENFKLGVQFGINLTPAFEVLIGAEGNLTNIQPQLASLDAFSSSRWIGLLPGATLSSGNQRTTLST